MVTSVRTLPPGAEVATPQRLICLQKPALLVALDELARQDSLNNLRSRLSGLLDQLDQPVCSLLAQPGSPDAIELSYAHLCSALRQIEQTQTLERACYYLKRLTKALTQVRTGRLNDINLNRWKEYDDINTDSLWLIPRRDGSGVHRADYWGNFVPQIPNQMLRRYTKQGDWVLDTFLGSGTTLIESQRLGRNGIGVELQPQIAERAAALIAHEPNPSGVTSQVVTADSASCDFRALLAAHGRQTAQLVILHPPYFDIIKFSPDEADLSNAPSVETFLTKLGQVVDNAAAVLEPGRYLVLVIGDKFSKGEWIPLGFMAMSEVQKRGFLLKSIVVKNFDSTTGKRHQKELWKYRALVGGFYVFKHEYIFVFRAPRL